MADQGISSDEDSDAGIVGCDKCEKKSHAVGYCKSCNQLFCSGCASIHTSQALTSSHQVIKLPTNEMDFGVVQDYCNCQSGVKTNFFCKSCSEGICDICFGDRHKGHQICMSKQFLLMLYGGSSFLTKMLKSVESNEPILSLRNLSFKKQNNDLKERIDEHVSDLVTKIKEQGVELKKQIENYEKLNDKKYQEIDGKLKEFRLIKAEFGEIMSLSGTSPKIKNPKRFVIALDLLEEIRMNKLAKITFDQTDEDLDTLLGFEFPKIKFQENYENNLGKLVFEDGDQDSCSFLDTSECRRMNLVRNSDSRNKLTRKLSAVSSESLEEQTLMETETPDLVVFDTHKINSGQKQISEAAHMADPVFDVHRNNSMEPSIVDGMKCKSGHKVTVMFGDITRVKSDVLVNFMNTQMEKEFTKISDDIISRAGKSVETEVIEKWSEANFYLTAGTVLATGGGSLPCDQIIHCVLPVCYNNFDEERLQFFKCVSEGLKASISRAKINVTNQLSVSVPLDLGEAFGLPADVVPKLILESVVLVLESLQMQLVVNFGLVTNDKSILSDVCGAIQPLLKAGSDLSATLLNGVKLNLRSGTICDEKVDAILIPIAQNFDLTTGQVSKEVLLRAGPDIQKDLYRQKSIQNGIIICTSGYGLPCRQVFYGCLASKKNCAEDIETIVVKSIELARVKGLTSLSMPALGTGVLSMTASVSSAVILKAILGFGNYKPSNLKEINIVIHPDRADIMRDFSNHMKALIPDLRTPAWSRQVVVAPVPVVDDAGSFLDLEQNMQNMKLGNMPNSFVKPEGKQNKISVPKYESLKANENFKMTEKMKKDYGSGKYADSTVSGGKMAEDSKKNGGASENANGKKFQWLYKEKNGKMMEYPEKINAILEKNFLLKKPESKWNENGKVFRVIYSTMKEEAVGEDDSVEVQRIEVTHQKKM